MATLVLRSSPRQVVNLEWRNQPNIQGFERGVGTEEDRAEQHHSTQFSEGVYI